MTPTESEIETQHDPAPVMPHKWRDRLIITALMLWIALGGFGFFFLMLLKDRADRMEMDIAKLDTVCQDDKCYSIRDVVMPNLVNNDFLLDDRIKEIEKGLTKDAE